MNDLRRTNSSSGRVTLQLGFSFGHNNDLTILREKLWNAKKTITYKHATVPMNRAAEKESAANASATICKKDSYPDVFSRKTRKKPTTGPSNILPIWLPESAYKKIVFHDLLLFSACLTKVHYAIDKNS